jgi:hypothetical protein
MGMFGTGRMPGAHGLVGLDVLDPDRGVLFNELAWDPAVDPAGGSPAAPSSRTSQRPAPAWCGSGRRSSTAPA